MGSFRYRAEIDGLRAVAVLGVIFYHAGLGFPGGYIGVDVFFVISGFLITGIIAREVEEKRFTLRGFWMRRIKRILPAMGVVVLAVLGAALVLIDPVALVDLGKSAAAQAMIASNIFFLRGDGYFSSAAELKPLLHTWSLSVEEQFYVFFPVVFMAVSKLGRRVLVALLLLLLCGSFLVGVLGVMGELRIWRSPNSDFYLLPSRAWELLAGALLALGVHRVRFSRGVAEGVGLLGLGLVLVPMFAYTSATPFPGLAAFPPVLGAVLIILANTGALTGSGKLLANRPIVLIGLMSYSLYLWHWPLLSLAHHVIADVRPHHKISLVLVAFLLALFSWKYVEIPFRSKDRLRTRTATFVFGGLVGGVVCATGILFWKLDGFPARFDEKTAEIIGDAYWNGTDYFETNGQKAELGERRRDSSGTGYKPDFVLLGDSHAMVIAKLIDDMAGEFGLSGAALLTSGRAPVNGLWQPQKANAQRAVSTRLSRARMDWIIDHGVKNVILVGRWNALCDGETPAELSLDPTHGAAQFLVADSPEMPLTPENSTRALRRQLVIMLAEFAKHEVKVWILRQVPESPSTQVAKTFMLHHRFPGLNGEIALGPVSRSFYELRRKNSDRVFEGLGSADVVVIDPEETFFGEAESFPAYAQRAYYRDDDHLTRFGAETYLRSMFTEVFSTIRASGRN